MACVPAAMSGEGVAAEGVAEVAAAYERLRERIAAACSRCGRSPEEVTLIGASKRQPPDRLQAAFDAGLRVFGENRVQEAEAKRPHLPDAARWHLIGPLQSNKVKRAVALFDAIESIDRAKIASALNRAAGARERPLDCYLEVNLGEEPSKHGYPPAEVLAAADRFGDLENLRLRGLMAIPPPGDSAEASRPWFVQLRRLRDRIRQSLGDRFSGELSMGMSADFEVAVEEGATAVRVGTALFGPRD